MLLLLFWKFRVNINYWTRKIRLFCNNYKSNTISRLCEYSLLINIDLLLVLNVRDLIMYILYIVRLIL